MNQDMGMWRSCVMAGLWAWLTTTALSGCGGNPADPATETRTPAQTVSELVAGKGYPGAVAVRVTMQRIDVSVAGVRRVAGAAVQPTDRFPVGSLTKSMTATLAALLVQDGRIAWDARLLSVLPELAGAARADYAGVTLRDLLAHRSGLFAAADAAQLAQVPELAGTALEQRLQFTTWALSRTPAVRPGQQTEYSNGSYVAAAAMLERVTGVAYETLIQARLFQPLGIAARFGAAGAAGATEAWGHTTLDGRTWQALDPASAEASLPVAANPAGGVKLNGDELGRYLQLHLRALRGQTGLLLKPETATLLHTVVHDGLALGWIAGFDLQRRPLSWHNGSDDTSYYALMAIRLDADGASAVLVNAHDARIESVLGGAATLLLP